MHTSDARRIVFVLLMATSALATAAPEQPAVPDADPPGCAIERARQRCSAAAGAEIQACNEAALKGAQDELRRVLDRVGPPMRQDPALLGAMAAAQMAWQSWIQRDCDTVSANYAGDALQPAMFTGCMYEHVLGRAQSLWQRHATPAGKPIPVGCLPGR